MKKLNLARISLTMSLAFFFCAGFAATAHAAVPKLLTYQGILKDNSGNFLTGSHSIVFRLYTASSGGSAAWTETHPTVSVASGKFSVQLGSITALGLDFSSDYWLSVQVGADAEMSPRVRLTSSGYSIRADYETNGFTEANHDDKSHKDIAGVKDNTVNIAKTNFKLDAYTLAAANSMSHLAIDTLNDASGINAGGSSNYIWRGSANYDVVLQPGGIDSDAKLALHANGSDASTTFTDSSSGTKTVTANGDAQIDTAQSKFGSASGLFDGNDYLSLANSNDFKYGTGDFTVEFWVRQSSFGTWNYFINDNNSSSGVSMRYRSAQGIEVHLLSSYYTFATTLSTNTWYHIALTRSGTSLRCFVNGSQVGSTQTSSDDIQTTQPIDIGSNPALDGVIGHMDEIRLSKGIARWTSTFTPSTTEYSSGGSGSATVISNAYSQAAAPTEAMVIVDETLGGGSITYSVSRDNGTTWTTCTKETVTDISGQPSGTQVKWKAVLTDDAELNAIAVAV